MRKKIICLMLVGMAGLSNAAPIAEPPQFSVDKPRSETSTNTMQDATYKAQVTCVTGSKPIAGLICMGVPLGWAEVEADSERWKEAKVKIWNASMDEINDTIEDWTKTCATQLMNTTDANKKVANFYCNWLVRSKIAALASSPPK